MIDFERWWETFNTLSQRDGVMNWHLKSKREIRKYFDAGFRPEAAVFAELQKDIRLHAAVQSLGKVSSL